MVNHYKLKEELQGIGHAEVDYVLDCVSIHDYWELLVDITKPQGHIVTIAGNSTPLNLSLLKSKSISFSWEFMFTRSMYTTDDIAKQHEILNELSELLDSGDLRTTLNTTLKGLTVENLKKAHQMQESGKTIGKTVIEF